MLEDYFFISFSIQNDCYFYYSYVSMFSKNRSFSVSQFKFFNFAWEEEEKYSGYNKTLTNVKIIAAHN